MAMFECNVNSNLGTEPILIGSYSGNQNINVSKYLKNGNTANNFFVVITGSSGSTATWIKKTGSANSGYSNTSASGFNLTKSLSGSTLSVGGMYYSANCYLYGSGEQPNGATATINWQLWYVG